MAVTPPANPSSSLHGKVKVNSLIIKQQFEIKENNISIKQKSNPLNAVSEPLKLIYQAAIDELNERLAPYLGEDALQKGLGANIDVSPEATAHRIVSLSTSMLSRFMDSNPQMEDQAAKEKFVSIIRDGVMQGFSEAREILKGLQVLEGDIAANIDKTFELVQKGLDNFLSPSEIAEE
ncbi:MAG: hypothetical protein COB51_03310 [Moraxellaceae bacterium]|nr:MAG: hypothetical protein COB51_03310 [Moraxellaceae bacterium]